jgi:hypothetical protein
MTCPAACPDSSESTRAQETYFRDVFIVPAGNLPIYPFPNPCGRGADHHTMVLARPPPRGRSPNFNHLAGRRPVVKTVQDSGDTPTCPCLLIRQPRNAVPVARVRASRQPWRAAGRSATGFTGSPRGQGHPAPAVRSIPALGDPALASPRAASAALGGNVIPPSTTDTRAADRRSYGRATRDKSQNPIVRSSSHEARQTSASPQPRSV